MKSLFFFIASLAFYASAVPVENRNGTRFQYPRFLKLAGADGKVHDVDLKAQPDMELIKDYRRNPNNNQYILFTRKNPTAGQTLIMNDADSIRNSNFNRNDPTVVIVHGWLESQTTQINPSIRDAFLGKSENNVIVLDWSRLALSGYITAATGAPEVGVGLGQFMNFLRQVTGASYNSMHLVGFSLGAHIVGNAGRTMGGRAARITGLDPAGPLWNLNSNRLSPSDGIYVEAIHTDGGYTVGGLGIGTAIAQVDFFPNGGISQPGCLANVCNHKRAWELFAATVSYNHLVGRECSNNLQISMNTCRGQILRMGNDILNKTGSGIYRLDTSRRYPY